MSLKAARLKLGLTQLQLARKAHVANRTIVYIENHRATPRFDTQRKLLKALGVPWDQRHLVFTKEDPTCAPSQEPLESSLQVQPES